MFYFEDKEKWGYCNYALVFFSAYDVFISLIYVAEHKFITY